MSDKNHVIAFTGGGSGGHIYPGLAVAEAILSLSPGTRIAWIGNEEGLDRKTVESAGIEFHGIPCGKFRRELSFKNVTDIAKIASGYFRAKKTLKSMKPSILFSKGGFVSVAPVRAASALGIPVFTHESDATPGLATRLNAPRAERIFAAYESAVAAFPEKYRSKVTVSGNPVRRVFFASDAEAGRRFAGFKGDKPLVLVLGGSQGARRINDLICANLDRLSSICDIVHQTGDANWPGDFPSLASDSYKPLPYIGKELPDLQTAANLVVSRAGAGTLWECAVTRTPMLLIPLTGATRGDQVINAGLFEKQGAAAVCPEGISNEGFFGLTKGLVEDKAKLASMAKAATKISNGDASIIIAKSILERIRR